MIRQGLVPDVPYCDAVVHGDGLTSLQFRDTPGGPTREVRANVLHKGFLVPKLQLRNALPRSSSFPVAKTLASPLAKQSFTEVGSQAGAWEPDAFFLVPKLQLRNALPRSSSFPVAKTLASPLAKQSFTEVGFQAGAWEPDGLRLQRHGQFIVMSVGGADGTFRHSGCARKHVFTDPVYVGLAVCADDNKVIEEAEFAEVRLTPVTPAGKPRLQSTLEIVPVGSKDRQAIYHSTTHFEAPNWSRDAIHFVFNSQGSLFRLPVKGGTPERIDTGSARRLQQRPRVLAGRTRDRHQRPFATRRQIADLHPAGGWRHAAADHAHGPVLLARLVAGRKDAGVLRRARRQVRRLHDPGRGRRTAAADDGGGARTTARNTAPTGARSTSTPTAPGGCRSGE